MRIWQKILLCIVALLGAHGAQGGQTNFYPVKPGDTLSAVFGKEATKVCELNKKLGKIRQCNRIYPKQLLQLPDDVVAPLVSHNGVQSVKTRTETNVFYWRNVGGAPLHDCGKKSENVLNEEAWIKMGLTEDERSELRGLVLFRQHQKETLLKPGDAFQAVAFCKEGQVAFEKNVIADWKQDLVVSARTYILKTGRVVHWVRNCNNWAMGQSIPRVADTPTTPPPVETPTTPPPVDDEPTVPPPADDPPAEEEHAPVCLFDPKAVVGQEHEPNRNGNDAHSTHLSAALYCTWRGVGGTHGLGFGLHGSWWNGHVNQGVGKYQGRMLAFGPGYEYIADDGWNLEAKLLFGRIHENFNQDQYASSRTINTVGPAVSANFGQRRARGEKFMPETRVFGMLGLPTSVKAEHSWEGKQLADTTELSRFGSYLSLGVHQDVYDFESITLWGRVGYFRESPVSETMNLRVGISDSYRICGIGAGLDFDLKNGGQAFGYGWWCDLVKGTNVVRAEYRLAQIVKETGTTFEKDGTLFVPMPTDKSD